MPENRLLSSLSPPNRDLILSRCSEIPLPLKTSLYDAGKTPDYAYFPTSGMVSVVTSMKDGLTAEVGVVGNEGIVGGLRLLGPGRLYTNAMIQLRSHRPQNFSQRTAETLSFFRGNPRSHS